ncbi:diacylglycerol/lipid kinase family protein [Cellulomonas composti]|uniref:Sphingosine kinase n=1 Tax=Cellulomonas composti TaxID=266130 RepID=A0A511JCD3_9CELL|nr:diacylglycerol kinase family protein [Cellulomonas composti]GEL95429.1 sphingosine kinase [Cellulomonas composti]
MSWQTWLAIAAGVLALAALVVALVVGRRQRELRRELEAAAREVSPRAQALARQVQDDGLRIAFVANPSKPDAAELRTAIELAVAERGLEAPIWLETTVEDPGVGQAREAVERGADIVVAAGGDGTVRAVAEGLVGTGVPMALLPMGTGNLLARNLDLPLGDVAVALEIAVDGQDRPIDVGWLRVVRYEDEDAERGGSRVPPDGKDDRDHLFLVIAGLGFDAAMVADADEQLKARVGWIAYFVAGIKHLHGTRTRAHVRLDDRPVTTTRLRSLLIGNCGRLPGGITLLPDAVLDDGWLDVAALDTRAGIAGWAQLLGEVVLQGVGKRGGNTKGIGRIDHTRAREVRVVVPAGEHAQVDGDIVGRVVEVVARVDPGSLVVRVPKA